MAVRNQVYLREKLSAALDRKSALFLFGLSFLAVYREVFETILFYAALWGQGNETAILAGLGAGAAALLLIAVLLLRWTSYRGLHGIVPLRRDRIRRHCYSSNHGRSFDRDSSDLR